MRIHHALALFLLATLHPARGDDFPSFRPQQIDPRVGEVCYALTLADVNGDGKADVVAVANDAVVWYENPSWARHDIIRGGTEKDNVCLQGSDLDGDGRVDFALGASWQPSNTKTGGTLQALTRTGAEEGKWRIVPLGSEPTLHRIRFGDVLGTGKPQLVVAPLQGRETKGPDWGLGNGCRIMVRTVPANPFATDWPTEVAEDSLHTVHNLQLLDLDGDGAMRSCSLAGKACSCSTGIQREVGQGPSSERGIKVLKPTRGRARSRSASSGMGSGTWRRSSPGMGSRSWFTHPPKSGDGLWDRRVIDEPVKWGHAVWCVDLDGDGDDELLIGQRDPNAQAGSTPKGPGVYAYDPKPGSDPLTFDRHVLEDGGVAVEDLVAGDLDGDGRAEVVAGRPSQP